jgi:endonuclease YncB( thermonuclease family)
VPAHELAAPSEPPIRTLTKGAYAAEVLRVLDGDTFAARVRLWPGLDITTKVRLRGIDAPEMKARCREERNLAEAARDALKAILVEGELTVLRVDLDKYGGRVVADAATTRTPDVSQALVAQGLARAYAGGRRQGWCGSWPDRSCFRLLPTRNRAVAHGRHIVEIRRKAAETRLSARFSHVTDLDLGRQEWVEAGCWLQRQRGGAFSSCSSSRRTTTTMAM